MNPEQWLSLKWNGGSTMSDRWLNQSKIIHLSTKKERFQRPSCKIVLWNQGFATMYIVSVYTRVGQHIFI